MTIRSHLMKLHPAALVLMSFLLIILTGTMLLKLPFATETGQILWVDALFTATSAVCVTGLVVVDTASSFSLFGQGVILGLFQIGGLGVMTISVALFQWLGRSVSIRLRLAMQDLFSHTPREDIIRLIKSVVLFTFAAEFFGTVLLTVHWWGEYSFGRALYLAVFHSVSAFCNAGFTLFPDSMVRYSDNILLNLTLCALIVVGGIGFPVLYELQLWLRQRKEKHVRLSMQTKTVLITSGVLILAGALMFGVLEHRTLKDMPSVADHILVPLFQSVTCRTAGFNTVDIGSLHDATLTMMIFLMFFGASPGSCGGGVKTTTLALLAAFTVTRVKGRHRVVIGKKSIPNETVTRSVSLVLVSLGLICIVLFMLLLGDNHPEGGGSRELFLAYLFETVSAFGTVGLSMGLTPELGLWGKCWIILMMIIGRVGVLTFAYIIVGSGTENGIEYSEENLMVG